MNNIFIISGPSGSGKTTLIEKLKEKFENIEFSVSYTTRKKRPGEIDGKNYYFIDENLFKSMIDRGKFVEWAKVFDFYYGTAVDEIRNKSRGKKVLLLDIDVQGASAIKKKFPESIMVFIEPPNHEKLKERLIRREKREDSEIVKRLEQSKKEIEKSKLFNFRIINDKLEAAINELSEIFISYLKKQGLK